MRYVHEQEASSSSMRSMTFKSRASLVLPEVPVLFATQLSFQVWTDQIQETLNSKKQGDAAFKGKDFVTAVECYTQVRNRKWVTFLKPRNIIPLELDSIRLIVSAVHRRWHNGIANSFCKEVFVLSDEQYASRGSW
jgi:hypothetical protein